MTGESDADDEPFGIFVFAAVRLAAFGRVQEEPSVPQSRLVCNHLQQLLSRVIGARAKKE
jgi:hypothetical protein